MAEAGYPIMLRLRDKQVAVIGGGKVGARKARNLLRAGARVLLISPVISDELRHLAHNSEIEWIAESYRRDMLNAYMPVLVIAATDDQRVNQTVAQDAHRIRALCNVCDGSGELSDFSNMALIEQPPLTIAMSSNGKSPALLRLLKQRLESALAAECGTLAQWLGELRAENGQHPPTQAQRQLLYEQIVSSDVLTLLQAGQEENARARFDELARQGGGP